MYCSAPPTLMRLLAQPDGVTGHRPDSPAARVGCAYQPGSPEPEISAADSRSGISWAARIRAAARVAFSNGSAVKMDDAGHPASWCCDKS
jgi:hypothetical protein